MYTDEQINGRVTEGVAFLNAAYGDEWVGKVNLDILDIGDTTKCVGAQLEGDYHTFQEKHDIYGYFVVSRGFDMWNGTTDERDALNRAWRQRVTDIRADTE